MKRPDDDLRRMNDRIRLGKAMRIVMGITRAVFLITICFVVLYPLLYMFSVSIRESRDLYDTSVIWIPKHFTLENYALVWETMEVSRTLPGTVLLSIVTTLLNVGVCSVIGYGFARFKFRGRGVLFALVIFTLIVPPQTVSIPMYIQFYAFDFLGLGRLPALFGGKAFTVNLLNTDWTLYLPALLGQGIRSGLFIFIFRQFFRGMPKELEEAAYIDGCGMLRTFVTIMAVNAGAAYISSLMFSFVWYWNEYYQIGLYFSEPRTLSVALGLLQGSLRSAGMDLYSDPYVQIAATQAGCLLTIAPLIVMFVFLQRKFTQSIDATGIKG